MITLSKDRDQYLRERFKEIYDHEPEEILDQDSIRERDLEIAIRLNNDKLASVALIIQAEESLKDIDKDHLSEDSKDDIRSTKAKLRFNKNVAKARYSMSWEKIRDLFLSGQHEVLEEHYTEDWDTEDLIEGGNQSSQ